jgi:hypothetical protein
MTDPNTPRFALPGTWGRINLASDAAMHKSIRRVVEHSVGRDDRLATIRADMRGRFEQAAGIAREHGAVDFHLALELAPGVPLPAWLSVFLPDFEQADFESLGLTELKEALGFGLLTQQGNEATSRTVLTKTHVHAVRQVHRRVQPATEENVEFEVLQVDYWLAAAEPNRLALMSFSTSFANHEEQMLELFDAVIGTVRWPAPATAAVTA